MEETTGTQEEVEQNEGTGGDAQNETLEAAFDEFAAKQEGADDSGVDDETADDSAGDSAAEQSAAIEEPQNTQQDDDPLAALSADELRHRLKSDEGRISVLQRKINDLESRTAASNPPRARPQMPTTPKEWETLREDFPEIAEGVEKYLNMHMSKLDAVTSSVSRIERAEQQQRRQAEEAALAERYPDWRDIAQSQDFDEWVKQQPRAVQSLRSSMYAADAAYMLDLYHQHTQPRNTDAAQNSTARRLTAKRQRALASAQETPNHRRVPTAADESDFENAFEQFASRRERMQR